MASRDHSVQRSQSCKLRKPGKIARVVKMLTQHLGHLSRAFITPLQQNGFDFFFFFLLLIFLEDVHLALKPLLPLRVRAGREATVLAGNYFRGCSSEKSGAMHC